MNLGGQHRTDINFSKHKNFKFLKKVKLKCLKKSKRPYYHHHGGQKDFTRSIMHRAVNQLSAGKLSNRRSYISSSGRKLKGIHISKLNFKFESFLKLYVWFKKSVYNTIWFLEPSKSKAQLFNLLPIKLLMIILALIASNQIRDNYCTTGKYEVNFLEYKK